MNDMKQAPQNLAENGTRVTFWGTIAMAVLLALLASYFASVLMRQPGSPVTYTGLAVFLLAPVAAVISIVLVIRRRQDLGSKLGFYATLGLGIMSVALFQGRAVSASLSVLVISIMAIRWLFPRQAHRQSYGVAAIALIAMWALEWINPFWRIHLEAARLGPVAAVAFVVILVTIVALQSWRSLSLRWKMGGIVAVLFLGTVAVAISGYYGLQSLRYQISNIYDFMLVPIVAINDADTALAAAQLNLGNLDEVGKAEIARNVKEIEADNQVTRDVIQKYDTEWVTTVSPEFTESLRQAGKLEWQQQELESLAKFHTEFDSYLATSERYIQSVQAGRPIKDLAGRAEASLQSSRDALHALIAINNQYAEFSNLEAQSAYRNALISGSLALGIGLVIGLLISFLIVASITGRLNELARFAAVVQQGKLDQRLVTVWNDEISLLGVAFNEMTANLQGSFATLEQRVAKRTRNLELAAEVGRSVSQVRALDIMLKDACELILKEFNLYYVQVYLADARQTNLVLEAGTGNVGAQLVGRGHSLPLDTGSINGRAATEKLSVVIPDTAQSATFRQNPLLPETRGEMAVPLIVADKVVGVLDMQSSEPGVLTREILPAFEALAGQLAVAVQNANLLAETEEARAQVEVQARRLVRQGWSEHLDAIHKPEQIGFVFDNNGVAPLAELDESRLPEDGKVISVPISVTGEPLGSLVIEVDEDTHSEESTELLNVVARQVAQQIENLRLLESAERYRYEAEEASRRLTREGWKSYAETAGAGLKYIYDLKEVRPLNGETLESGANVPLRVRDEVVGTFAIQGLDTSDNEAVNLANTVAERLSAHIESLRQYDLTQSALAQSEKLFKASRQLTQSENLQDLVKAAVEALGIHEIDRVILGGLDYSSAGDLTGMSIIANWSNHADLQATPVGTHYPKEVLSSVSLFSSSQPLFFNDMWQDERVDETTLALAKRLNYRAVAALPLYVGARQDAILLFEGEQPHSFTSEEIRLFASLAPQLATVLENRRQFERAQEQAKREAMLNAINQKIQGATSVEAVLQIAARELGHALGAPMTVAQLSLKDKSS
jgi:GAF domain-containing protein/HAMP domain-containing protein